ncbi:Uncharacterised protein [Mycobacterium tuberculosis]|uniref:Uncharacterized protein n=1 Tax=Mycobacterium tuberculosis TaxID=1773 RepID=A0A654ZTZ7_MYCTX|nr:Uncharacterised protein [Mycobacterium tuberculosis]CKP12853.1 Uncharacterised protein [Mycobacterium tuberculosis]CKP24882.1 Uncharacterised protein [Mycobacterium tuberculosis]CKR16768.1 Uncharacterised protein [Mycobacterium tuberculosis]CKR65420.1 Uncharacterised protein [Mycobacterium tuberculosis]
MDNICSSRSAAIIAVRCRAQGTAVANAYHASSHKKQMSGLIASTSSITRRGLYTTPSNVQLVSNSMRTRCSCPAASRSSSACLMVRNGTAP